MKKSFLLFVCGISLILSPLAMAEGAATGGNPDDKRGSDTGRQQSGTDYYDQKGKPPVNVGTPLTQAQVNDLMAQWGNGDRVNLLKNGVRAADY